MEVTDYYYRNIWSGIYPELAYLPDELEKFHNDSSNMAYNMGIVGGNNISFFKSFCKKSIDFVDANKASWPKINGLHFNVFFEQLLFCKHAEQTRQKVDFLFPEMPTDNEYFGFADFHEVPDKTYLHLLGNYKKEPIICKFMEQYLMKFYPREYSNLGQILNGFSNNTSEITDLNLEIVEKLDQEFEAELRSNEFNSCRFLLKRDLYNADLFQKIDRFFKNSQNFSIVKIIGFEVESNPSGQNFLSIEESNAPFRQYELDEFDEIVLHEIKEPILYFDLLQIMKNYLEEQDEESINELVGLLNTKLGNYIRLKIISIYN